MDQDHWLVYGRYTRDIYQRMYEALRDFTPFEGIEPLIDEAARLARHAGYADANTLLMLFDMKFISENTVELSVSDENTYLSNVCKSSQYLSGVARTMKTAYEVRNALQGVAEAYELGRRRRLDETNPSRRPADNELKENDDAETA